jgi:hypothetical protein
MTTWLQNIRPALTFPTKSQFGEDQIAFSILSNIDKVTEKGFVVDIGANTFHGSNSKLFMEHGFDALRFDGKEDPNAEDLKVHWMTKDNIVELLKMYGCPKKFELLSIDVDGNDLYLLNEIWKAGYKPSLVIAEINPKFKREESFTIAYNENHTFQNNDYYGMSFEALKRVGKKYGYVPIYIHVGINAFFIRKELIEGLGEPVINYTKKQDWPHKPGMQWIEVTEGGL